MTAALAATLVSAVLGQSAPAPPVLSPPDAAWREAGTAAVWTDCATWGTCGDRTPQSIADGLVNFVVNGGRPDGLSILDYAEGRAAADFMRWELGSPPPNPWDVPGYFVPPDYVSRCESGDNVEAYNPNGHYGKWQFSLATWESVGGSGDPRDATEAEQDYRAGLLWLRDGPSQWSCA